MDVPLEDIYQPSYLSLVLANVLKFGIMLNAPFSCLSYQIFLLD